MSLPELIPSDLPVFVRKSSRADFANSVVPDGAALLFAQSDSHSGVRFLTKNHDGTYKEVGGGADITLGVVDSNGKFQPLKFDGTDASESGQPETVVNYKSWNSTYPPPGPVPAAMNFYKCASVDTSNSTWNGHLASISDSTGIWYFSSDSTSLVYDRLKPVVGSVYDEGCSFQVVKYNTGLPEDGQVFYAPLDAVHATAETEQLLTTYGNPSYTEYQGLPCINMTQTNQYIKCSNDTLPTGNVAVTLSCWVNIPSDYSLGQYQYWVPMYYGNTDWNNSAYILITRENMEVNNCGYGSASFSPGWHHVAGVRTADGQIIYYVNGLSIKNTTTQEYIASYNDLVIGSGPYTPNNNNKFYGYISSVRIYNRALDSTEISALANEFTPTAS